MCVKKTHTFLKVTIKIEIKMIIVIMTTKLNWSLKNVHLDCFSFCYEKKNTSAPRAENQANILRTKN